MDMRVLLNNYAIGHMVSAELLNSGRQYCQSKKHKQAPFLAEVIFKYRRGVTHIVNGTPRKGATDPFDVIEKVIYELVKAGVELKEEISGYEIVVTSFASEGVTGTKDKKNRIFYRCGDRVARFWINDVPDVPPSKGADTNEQDQ
jgi:hypothetical protein